MRELREIGTYRELREALGTELHNQAEGFVRTGYLLKVARDTDILKESGYATVAEFAQAEYGLTKDVVSRYIAINDRYSEGGYSEKLEEKYQGYGIAKLQDMLTMPDSVLEMMSPELTRKEINEVRKEVKEEEENPLASLMEPEPEGQQEMSNLQKALCQYFHDNREKFKAIAEILQMDTGRATEAALDLFAPSGVGMESIRVPGVGKILLSFRGKDREVEVLHIRTGEKGSYPWESFLQELKEIFPVKEDYRKVWEQIYREPYEEKKAGVAPVQPVMEKSILHRRQEGEEWQQEEDVQREAEQEPEGKLPGQMELEADFPEYLPEEKETGKSREEAFRILDSIRAEMEAGAYGNAVLYAKELLRCLHGIKERSHEE